MAGSTVKRARACRGVVLGLFSETIFEPRVGRVAEGFRGFSLTINCEDAQGVFRAQIRDYDDFADMDKQPEQSGWGCGFSFRDPEGNVWDVAFKHGSDFDHRGGFIYP